MHRMLSQQPSELHTELWANLKCSELCRSRITSKIACFVFKNNNKCQSTQQVRQHLCGEKESMLQVNALHPNWKSGTCTLGFREEDGWREEYHGNRAGTKVVQVTIAFSISIPREKKTKIKCWNCCMQSTAIAGQMKQENAGHAMTVEKENLKECVHD